MHADRGAVIDAGRIGISLDCGPPGAAPELPRCAPRAAALSLHAVVPGKAFSATMGLAAAAGSATAGQATASSATADSAAAGIAAGGRATRERSGRKMRTPPRGGGGGGRRRRARDLPFPQCRRQIISKSTGRRAPGASRCDTLVASPLDQLDLVAVRILREGDHGGSVLHGACLPRDDAAAALDLGAGRLGVVHLDGDMAVAGAQLVTRRVPVVGQLEGRLLGLRPEA